MSNQVRSVVTILSLFGWLLSGAAGQTQTSQKKQVTGVVAGRVTVNGKGIGGVIVSLRGAEFGPQTTPVQYKATSDVEGNYRITGVPAGNYQVAPMAPAYVINESSGRTKTLILGEGETVEGIDFSLVRGGVITGKVTNADGRPLIEEPVYLLSADANIQGQISSSQTDDRGIYRMFGVAAGRYTVAIGQNGRNGANYRQGRLPYEQTFHPGVTDVSKATTIELAEGMEVSNVDIIVGRPVKTFSASGRVVDAVSGQPVPNARFAIRTVGEQGGSTNGYVTPSNAQGDFRIENLTPGKYSVLMFPQPGSDLRSDDVPFQIIDQDVSDLLVKASVGASIAGTLVIDAADNKAAVGQLGQLRVLAFVRSENAGAGIAEWSLIGPDGSFRIGGLQAGVASLSISAQSGPPPKGLSIARVERDGVVQPSGIEIKTAEQITGVRVVVAYGTGSISGVVKFENGELPANAQIAVRLSRSGETSNDMNLRSRRVDSRGHFLIDGLTAGTYEVIVTAFVPGSRNRPPRTVQSVNVTNGAITEVTLTLDLAANTGTPGP